MSRSDRDQSGRPHTGKDCAESAVGEEAPVQKVHGLEKFLHESRAAVSTPEHKKAAASAPATFTF